MAPRKESCFPSSSKQCCFVCESPHGASPHFGTVSCLACAAFFRRTVSLNISFQCKSKAKGTCRIFHELRMICRSCRYDKCIKAGMQRTCVQKRRDMDIIMRSRSAARQSMTQLEIYSNTSSEDSPEIERCRSSESVSQEPFSPEVDVKPQIDHFMIETENSSSQRILDFYIQQDNKAMDRRRVMFGNEDIGSLVDDRGGIPFTRESLVPYTVKAHHTYIRFDHVLTLEFLKALPGFSKLEKSDRLSLYRYWILGISSVDSSFITSQMGLVDENLLVLTNGTYLSAKDTSIGYDGEDDMSSEEKEKLFWPMYNLLNHKLTRPMHRLKVNQIEFVAMKALSIWQAVYFELSAEGKRMAKQHQTAIIEGLHDYYKDKPDGETRMGNIILFIGSLFDVYKIIIDNYRQFEVFNLVKLDVFSRQLLCM
ncbi:hypothetical protein L596_024132 [Steinernema carpocapsae]|nr:hypothetical protein L596_024132 [Steinernema carpocapsae]